MATLDGAAIFGYATTCATADNPRGTQTNAYPGLSGLEELDQGLRGRFTTISGILIGAAAIDVQAAEGAIRSFNDGLAHTLVDNYGGTWLYVKYESFEPQGKVGLSSDLLGLGPCYFRRYTARFKHLV